MVWFVLVFFFFHSSGQQDVEIFKAMYFLNLQKDGNKLEGILLLWQL